MALLSAMLTDWFPQELAFCFLPSISEHTPHFPPFFVPQISAPTSLTQISQDNLGEGMLSSSCDQMDKPSCVCPYSLLFPSVVPLPLPFAM